MKRLVALGLMAVLLGVVTALPAAPSKDSVANKKALQELQDFIGGWKGSGQTKPKPGPRDPFWSETVSWGWRFKGDDCWLILDFKGGKFLKSAEIRYVPKTKKYQMIGLETDGKTKVTFDGTLKDEKLTFERVDPKTKQTQQVVMNLAAEGVRFIYQVKRKTGTLWKLEYMVAATKEGKSLGNKEKGPECIVSGGRGTSTVSFKGQTYYVCCSGCRDEFNANPQKYVDEWNKKKGK